MKCLTVKQPWAWLIVNGYKDVENRSWITNHRGELGIHAGKAFDKNGYEWVKNTFPEIPLPDKKDFKYGGIIGKVAVVNCVDVYQSDWAEIEENIYNWVLDNPEKLDFIPCKGKLSLWNYEPEIKNNLQERNVYCNHIEKAVPDSHK